MTDDLYALFGVPRTATKDEIKKAFRKKMKDAHPDREDGDHELAVKLNLAWDILGNDEKRKIYDETGAIPGNCEPSLDDKARQCLASAFAQMLADEIDFPTNQDPLARLLKAMKDSIAQYEYEVKAIDSYLAKLDKKLARVKFTGTGMDIWTAVIEDKKRKHEGNRQKFKEAIEVTNRSLEIIKDYQGQFVPAINPGQSELERQAADMQRQFQQQGFGYQQTTNQSMWENLFGGKR
jgi:curved DNA-binding protein CbpA